jgi:Mrp family chromosome partitioning ATPase
VGSLADSVVLASIADMAIVVVKQNQHDRELVRRTLKRLRDINANIIGAILNNVDVAKSSHRDYYYSGYYNSDDETDRRGPRPMTGADKAAKKSGRVAL